MIDTTNSVNTATPSLSAAAGFGRGELGRDAFLNLLVTQLRNQSPLQPQDNSEFIAQLAQFSQLENAEQANTRMGELLDSMRFSQGTALVGKEVSFGPGGEDSERGRVERAFVVGGQVELQIEGRRVPLSDVHSVSE